MVDVGYIGRGVPPAASANVCAMNDPRRDRDPLQLLFDTLDQAGPGSEQSTLAALARLPPLRNGAIILDLGCGPGRHTLTLARATSARIIAVDVNGEALSRLIGRAEAAGFGERIAVREGSMMALTEAPGTVDLIWSEGASYIVGVENALRYWRPALRPRGHVALTELVWTSEARPAPAVAFWRNGYPAMSDIPAVRQVCERCGYRLIDTLHLPPEDWTEHYYQPLSDRIAKLRDLAAEWPDLAAIIEETEEEMDLYHRYGDSFGYVFFLLEKAG